MSSAPHVRRSPVAGAISLGWVVLCWIVFLVVTETNAFGFDITGVVLMWTAIAGYVGGIPGAITSFVRGERRAFGVITIILLVISPVLFFALAIFYLATDVY